MNPKKTQRCSNCKHFGKVTYLSDVMGIYHDCAVTAGIIEAHSWCTRWEEASEDELVRIRKELADALRNTKKG